MFGNIAKIMNLGSTAMMLVMAITSRNSGLFSMTLISLIDSVGDIAKIKELDMDDERKVRMQPELEAFTAAIFREIDIGVKKK